MIDFFHKGAEINKRITGVATLKGAPVVEPRPLDKPRRIGRIATFFDGDKKLCSLLLEVADTPEKRRNGLMGREKMPNVCGMMFDGLEGGGYFWMKGCLMPIDVAFIDKDGKVTKTYSMPVDKDGEKHYDYDEDDKSAIEMNQGVLARKGISKGCMVEIRELKGRQKKEEDDE